MIPQRATYEPIPADRGYLRALAAQSTARRLSFSISSVLYNGLAVVGWLATTLLATAGLFVALFVAAGNGTFDGFFEQVALLSTHYGQVDAVARAPFNRELTIAFAVVLAITGFFRRASLVRIFTTGGVDGLR